LGCPQSSCRKRFKFNKCILKFKSSAFQFSFKIELFGQPNILYYFFADIILNKMFYELNIYIVLFQCNINDNLNNLVVFDLKKISFAARKFNNK